ncbi:MAG: fibrobacter succinogenes major paralogous domain-containing protein [Flavobacteriales bacterium]
MRFKIHSIVAAIAFFSSIDAKGQGCEPVTYDGYTYKVVQIGDQCWFAENLRTRRYANGDAIPVDSSDEQLSEMNQGARVVYGEDERCNNKSPDGDACDPNWSLKEYGRLYNSLAMNDGRGLCPSGWHVPTDGEFMALEMELGVSEVECNKVFWRGTDQGTQLKATYGWNDDGNGENSSGFSGLPGGVRLFDGRFRGAGSYGVWWSSSPAGSEFWNRTLFDVGSDITRHNSGSGTFLSVRCLKDDKDDE